MGNTPWIAEVNLYIIIGVQLFPTSHSVPTVIVALIVTLTLTLMEDSAALIDPLVKRIVISNVLHKLDCGMVFRFRL